MSPGCRSPASPVTAAMAQEPELHRETSLRAAASTCRPGIAPFHPSGSSTASWSVSDLERSPMSPAARMLRLHNEVSALPLDGLPAPGATPSSIPSPYVLVTFPSCQEFGHLPQPDRLHAGRGGGKQVFHDEPLPTGPCDGVSRERVVIFDAQESMNKTAIPHIDLGRLDQAFLDVGVVRAQAAHQQKVYKQVDIGADRGAADALLCRQALLSFPMPIPSIDEFCSLRSQLSACYSARAFDADRHGNLLISFDLEGSKFRADQQPARW